jgi:hypothetical protein
MTFNHCTSLLIAVGFLVAACGQEPVRVERQATPPNAAASSQAAITIQPDRPTAGNCLHVVGQGQTNRSSYRWEVNGQQVAADQSGKLCNAFGRGDQVTVHAGTVSAMVAIGNSLPLVTGISATPKQLFAGVDVEVFPIGEDKDGDPVEFRYQWLINNETNPFLTEAKLPGNRFVKGDRLQVRITPFDGQDEGPVYQSYVMTVPNAPPRITSQPPQNFEALEYQYQAKSSDPDGDQLAYQLAKAPQGMAINAAGLVSWPLTGVKPGVYPVKIVISDPEGAETVQEFNLTLGTPSQVEGRTKP